LIIKIKLPCSSTDVSSRSPGYLINRGKEMSVDAETNGSKILLPCVVNDYTYQPNLTAISVGGNGSISV